MGQVEKGASIFACNEYCVISTEKVSLGKDRKGHDVWTWVNDLPSVPMGQFGKNGSTTSSYLNTRTFIWAWDTLLNSGKLWKHDWVVKVDPDAVFFPYRLRTHLEKYDDGTKSFLLNCNWAGEAKIFGALEVYSTSAMRSYQEHVMTCKQLGWEGWGEDLYMQVCMQHHVNATGIEDLELVGDARCSNVPCVDEWRVAFHPFKDTEGYWACYQESIGR